MTAVTQKIPNFIGGISQQPDELKPEGSLRDALNVIPDVTDGLKKRAGSRLINPLLTDEEGSWFHFNFSDDEKYIGNIAKLTGEVRVFNCSNGLATPVQYLEYDTSGETPTTGYPDCNLTDYTTKKLDYLEAQREYDAANAVYNDYLSDDDKTEEEREEKLEIVNEKKEEMDAAYDLYSDEADKCGLSLPSAQLRSTITDVAPDYLKHQKNGQIRNLVIGNRVYFINPSVQTSINDSGIPRRQRENFIEINTAAAMQDYSIELVAEDTEITPYNEVREVEVIKGNFDGDDGQCPFIGGPVEETFNDGNKQNLVLEMTVQGTQFLAGNGNSLSDYACKYRANVKIINPGVNWEVGDTVEMEVSGRKYTIRIDETETMYTAEGAPITVPPTPDGVEQPVKAATILTELKSAIETYDSNFVCKIIGNGIWVVHNDPDYVWRFSTPNKALMTITTDEATSIVQLPTQCRGGYTVKVTNTESDDDDYYAIFETEETGIDGPGAWVETVEPGLNRYINAATMPHQLVRQSNGNFVVSPVSWEPRLVGDNKTNPKPGFLSKPQQNDFRFIENMVLFRNRLCILSGDTITCSRTGDYFNFWSASALTTADNDPVDIAAGSSSTSSNATLMDAIEIGQGLVCLSGDEQFVLSSGQDAFTPSNARISRVGTYRYSGFNTVKDGVNGVPVFSLGTSIGFLSNAGLHTRLVEMFNIGQTAEASVNELTKPISKLIPQGINLLADSKDNNLVVLSRRDSNELWVYRYFDNDQRRVQSAWFKWTLPAKLAYHCIMDDVYWSVTYSNSSSEINNQAKIISLQRIDLKDNLASAFVYDSWKPSSEAGEIDVKEDNDTPYTAHLDNYRIAQPSELTYYTHLNQTYFRAPIIYYKDLADVGRLRAYMLSPTILQRDAGYTFESVGASIPIKVEEDNLGTWFVMDGDWSGTRMMIGYVYDMQVEIPTIYPSKTQSTNNGPVTTRDTRAYLNLHRLKVNLGQVGVYETTLKVLGRDDYTELYECKTMDDYPANEVAFDQRKTQVVPVYAKNTDTSIVISSDHPSPCTIYSLEWEGDYGAKWYKSV